MAKVTIANNHWVKNGSSVGTMGGGAVKFTGSVECGARSGSNLDTVKFTFNYNFNPRDYPGDNWNWNDYHSGEGWKCTFVVDGVTQGSKSWTQLGGGVSGSISYNVKFADDRKQTTVRFILTGYNWDENLSGNLEFGAKSATTTYTDIGKPGTPTISPSDVAVNSIKWSWSAAAAGTNNKVGKYVIDIYAKDYGKDWPSSPTWSVNNGTSTIYTKDISSVAHGKQFRAQVKAYGASYHTSISQNSGYSAVVRKNLLPAIPTLSVGTNGTVAVSEEVKLTTAGDDFGQKTSGKVTATLTVGDKKVSSSVNSKNGIVSLSGANLVALASNSKTYTITGVCNDGYETGSTRTITGVKIGKTFSMASIADLTVWDGTTLKIPVAKIDGQYCRDGSITYRVLGKVDGKDAKWTEIAVITKKDTSTISEQATISNLYKTFMSKVVGANGASTTLGYIQVDAAFKGFQYSSNVATLNFTHPKVASFSLSNIDGSQTYYTEMGANRGTNNNPFFFKNQITCTISINEDDVKDYAGNSVAQVYAGNKLIKNSPILDNQQSVSVSISKGELSKAGVSGAFTLKIKVVQTVDSTNYNIQDVNLTGNHYFKLNENPDFSITGMTVNVQNGSLGSEAQDKVLSGTFSKTTTKGELIYHKVYCTLTSLNETKTFTLTGANLESNLIDFSFKRGALETENNKLVFPVTFLIGTISSKQNVSVNTDWTLTFSIEYGIKYYTDTNKTSYAYSSLKKVSASAKTKISTKHEILNISQGSIALVD